MRGLHTSPVRPAWFFLSGPLVRGMVALGARAGRRVWKGWSEERRQKVKDAIRKRSGYVIAGVGALTTYGAGYYLYHVEEAPLTGRRRFMMIDRPQLQSMIEKEGSDLVTSISGGHPILPPSHPAYSEIVPILERIIPILSSHWVGGTDDIKWILYVIDNPNVANAMCLPSGKIFVHSGLLKVCQNQDELAFILSHEVAHVLMNHGGELLSNRGLVNFFLLFVVAGLWAIIPSDLVSFFLHKWSLSLTEILFHLPYSRELEEEADTIGFLVASSACYEPAKSMQIWSHFPTPSAKEVPEYLSTHPVNDLRLNALKELLPQANHAWKESGCSVMQNESVDFKAIVNKTLKKLFKKTTPS